MTPIRVGLIGARRARQGLGPFVARDLHAAGAEVTCFLATSEESRDEASLQLARFASVQPRGHLDLSSMLRKERLDALAICSPHETHAPLLHAALEAGLHVLCEKPLVWGVAALADTAERLASRFASRGLALWENCQWPYTLPAFERLHPGALDAPPRRFAMRLQPSGRGVHMLADSLPHPLSLLQRLAPGETPQLSEVRFSSTDAAAGSYRIEFAYRAGSAEVETQVELRPTRDLRREARLEIDGRGARRLVTGGDYRLSFHDGDRAVPVDDPLTLLIADFVRALERGVDDPATGSREIVERMAMLEEVATAWTRASG